jgi:hypothetical protein
MFYCMAALCFMCAHWEIIADNLSNSIFSWGCSSQIDSTGQELFTADAFAHGGRRFIVLSDEKLSALLELERVTGVSLGEKNDRHDAITVLYIDANDGNHGFLRTP